MWFAYKILSPESIRSIKVEKSGRAVIPPPSALDKVSVNVHILQSK